MASVIFGQVWGAQSSCLLLPFKLSDNNVAEAIYLNRAFQTILTYQNDNQKTRSVLSISNSIDVPA